MSPASDLARDDTSAVVPSDETLRGMCDDDGILQSEARVSLPAPPRTACFTVFAQRSDARVELSTWEGHASRFFSARLGLTIEKRYSPARGFPDVDVARVVLAPPNAPGATRFCYARPRDADDLHAAESADIAAGSPGLGLLARRCPYVWLVVAETARDEVALLLAAILASVVLGPILAPDQAELFGVRTARLKLEALSRGAPYR